MTGCWVSDEGKLNYAGYSILTVAPYREQLGHIFAYEALVGPVPAGLELNHLCNNRACYNPRHLEPVTHAENMRRAKLRRERCRKGHPYDEANTYWWKGQRCCRACRKELW